MCLMLKNHDNNDIFLNKISTKKIFFTSKGHINNFNTIIILFDLF